MRKKYIVVILSGLTVLLLAVSAFGIYTYASQSGYDQGYHVGHTAGLSQGEQDGYTRGQSDQKNTDGIAVQAAYQSGQQGFTTFYEWLTNACVRDFNNYYQVVVWYGGDSQYHYSCIA